MPERNYLIGFGERLVHQVDLTGGGGPKKHPYDFESARQALAPRWRNVGDRIRTLPDLACPHGETVIALTLHPSYLAKSYYPANLLRDLALRPVGSCARHILPRATPTKKKQKADAAPLKQVAPQIFVAGRRDDINSFASALPNWRPGGLVADDFRKLEDVEPLGLARLKPIPGDDDVVPLEVVLHVGEGSDDDYVIEGFRAYVASLDLKVNLDHRLYAGGLCFLPLRAPRELLDDVVKFSFLRVVRRMPRLSYNDQILRSAGSSGSFKVSLPDLVH